MYEERLHQVFLKNPLYATNTVKYDMTVGLEGQTNSITACSLALYMFSKNVSEYRKQIFSFICMDLQCTVYSIVFFELINHLNPWLSNGHWYGTR